MAAPNIVSVSNILGKSNVANITTVTSNVIVNGSGSGKVFKINTIIISNVDGSSASNVTVGLYKAGNTGSQRSADGTLANTVFSIANVVTVPARSSLDLLSKTLYLEEGDVITVKSDANNRLHMIASFEEIS
jgi:hypothetical protein